VLQDVTVVTAFVDESHRDNQGLRLYVLAATIPFRDDLDDYRAALVSLLPPRAKKVHWYQAVDAHREEIMDLLAGFDAMYLVVARNMIEGEKPERARMKCIDVMASEAAQFGVTQAIFESRTTGLDNGDLKQLNFLRSSKSLPSAFPAQHVAGALEPMLWPSDAICGAIGDRELYNDRRWWDRVEAMTHLTFATH
jgi:hypothetical protein